MTASRVILITVAGPGGHVDVGVRSDATPAELAAALGTVLRVSLAETVPEHRSPPRPGTPEGQRSQLSTVGSLAEAGVADGDLVLFRQRADSSDSPDSSGGPVAPEAARARSTTTRGMAGAAEAAPEGGLRRHGRR